MNPDPKILAMFKTYKSATARREGHRVKLLDVQPAIWGWVFDIEHPDGKREKRGVLEMSDYRTED